MAALVGKMAKLTTIVAADLRHVTLGTIAFDSTGTGTRRARREERHSGGIVFCCQSLRFKGISNPAHCECHMHTHVFLQPVNILVIAFFALKVINAQLQG